MTLNLQVGASADDAHEIANDTGFASDAATLRIIAAQFSYDRQHAGARFTMTGPASGDTIDVAYASLYTTDGTDKVISADVYAEDVDSAANYSDTADLINRTKTTANVYWSADFTQNAFNDSPSIVSVVQEVVDRAGWASGNAINIIYWARSPVSRLNCLATSYDGSGANAPKLHVEYTAAGGGDPEGRLVGGKLVGGGLLIGGVLIG